MFHAALDFSHGPPLADHCWTNGSVFILSTISLIHRMQKKFSTTIHPTSPETLVKVCLESGISLAYNLESLIMYLFIIVYISVYLFIYLFYVFI